MSCSGFGFVLRPTLWAALALMALATPAHAANDWYKMGYTEGYLYQERLCQQQLQQKVQLQYERLNTENQRLRQEVIRLRQLVEAQAATVPAATQENAQAQYFQYPTGDQPDKFSGNAAAPAQNAAAVPTDDDSGG
jgi:hypothetical protein